MFKQYINYITDNPKKYWFKRKLYGWGWTPATWQGWLVILAFLGAIIWDATTLNPKANTHETVVFFVTVLVTVAILILICYLTGESPRWQWGKPKQPNDEP